MTHTTIIFVRSTYKSYSSHLSLTLRIIRRQWMHVKRSLTWQQHLELAYSTDDTTRKTDRKMRGDSGCFLICDFKLPQNDAFSRNVGGNCVHSRHESEKGLLVLSRFSRRKGNNNNVVSHFPSVPFTSHLNLWKKSRSFLFNIKPPSQKQYLLFMFFGGVRSVRNLTKFGSFPVQTLLADIRKEGKPGARQSQHPCMATVFPKVSKSRWKEMALFPSLRWHK